MGTCGEHWGRLGRYIIAGMEGRAAVYWISRSEIVGAKICCHRADWRSGTGLAPVSKFADFWASMYLASAPPAPTTRTASPPYFTNVQQHGSLTLPVPLLPSCSSSVLSSRTAPPLALPPPTIQLPPTPPSLPKSFPTTQTGRSTSQVGRWWWVPLEREISLRRRGR